MSFRLAAQEWMLDGDTLEEKYAYARSVGFDGIELAARSDDFAERAGELRSARAAGVVMPSAVVIPRHFIGEFDPDGRRHGIDDLKGFLATLGEAGAEGIVTPNGFGVHSLHLPPFAPPRPQEESARLLRQALVEVAADAVATGTTVYLEPLNRFEDYLVNTLDDAVAVVDDVASPAVRICADTFHMSIEEADIGAAIRRAGSRIAHVQLGDSNRLEPGAGHYDWPETLDALEDIGYHGWLALECRLSGAAGDVLPRVAELLAR